MRKKLMDCGGYIVVETISTFILFIFVMVAILSLINIVSVQARIHYAVTQAAETISVYNYVLEAIGMAEPLQKSAEMREGVEAEANEMKGHINTVIDGIQSLASGNISQSTINQIQTGGQNAVNKAQAWTDDFSEDPKGSIQKIMNYGLGEVQSKLFERLLRPLIGHYLGNGTWDGDTYLRAYNVGDGTDGGYGINGLVFSDFSLFDLGAAEGNDSTIMTSKGEVRIIVRYDVDYFFGILEPIGLPRLHITQEVITRCWLGGKGEGYKG